MNLIKIFRCNFSATEIEMFFNAKDADGDGVISAKVFQQGRVFQIKHFVGNMKIATITLSRLPDSRQLTSIQVNHSTNYLHFDNLQQN